VVLFFRVLEIGYYEPFTNHHDAHHKDEEIHVSEVPWDMLVPLLMAAILLLALGIFTGHIVTTIIQFAIPTGII
ncbi:MAG: monovalent cation/H+ antiporter subunit D family protein, partial [Deltaproteobacteria bacterium]|nr:monovalent cation/H+ antiporter subunit D family protein [Deltaproteobacteria bacterium]